MAKTYDQLIRESEALKARAEVLRKKEMAGVIQKIKVAIGHYGISAMDLGFDSAPTTKTEVKAKVPAKGRAPVAQPKYRDGNGNKWSGFGPRPAWLKAAIAAGKTLEDFGAAPPSPSATVTSQAKPAPKQKLPAKYRDDAGNTWSGRGSTPLWLKSALAEGKTLEQLAA